MFKQIVGEDNVVDVNSRATLYAAFLIGVIAPEVFIVQPGFVQGLVQYIGFDEKQAGYVTSMEMVGLAVTTVVMTFAAHRLNWRVVVFSSVLVMFIANALCAMTTDLQVFTALRVIAGLGAGGLVSLGFAIIGLTRNPDRNFGLLIMWVLTYGAIVLLVMPSAYSMIGMSGVLWFFALFPLLAVPFIKHLPTNGSTSVQVEDDAINISAPLKAAALVAMLAYFSAQGVIWAYLFLIGLQGGLGEQQVANGLMLSQFAGIAGALLAATVANRLGRAGPLAIGILGGAACLYFLTGAMEFLVFAVAVGIYNFAWNMVHPYLLAAMASFDRHGRVVVYAVAMQMIGLAVGPALAASVISEGSLVNVNKLGAVLFAASCLLILPPVIVQARQYRSRGVF